MNIRKGNNNESAGDPGTGSSMNHSPEFFRDARGNTYQSVRFCDLDRLCDK